MQEESLLRYKKNLDYFRSYDIALYNKVINFLDMLSSGELEARYDLMYKDGFYLYNIKNSKKEPSNTIDSLGRFDTTSFEIFDDLYIKQLGLVSEEQKAINSVKEIVSSISDKYSLKPSSYKTIIFGIPFDNALNQLYAKDTVYLICEPDIEKFYLSLYVIDWEYIFKDNYIIYSILDSDVGLQKKFYNFFLYNFNFNYTISYLQTYNSYNFLFDQLSIALNQNNPLSYSYERMLLSIKNKMQNSQKYKFLDLTYPIFTKKESVIIVSMGPSLSKDLKYIKKNRKKLIIVAYIQSIKILYENNIKPDIATIVDSTSLMKKFLSKKYKIFLKDTRLFATSDINSKIFTYFQQKNIYLFDKENENIIGNTIGESTYHLILKLGAKQIYLSGVDLGYSKDDQLFHKSHTVESNRGDYKNSNNKKNPNNTYVQIKGNYRNKVKTDIFFMQVIQNYNNITKQYPERKIYNLSDGAYLDGTISIKRFKKIKKIKKDIIICSKKNIENFYQIKQEIIYLNSIDLKYIKNIDLEEFNKSLKELSLSLLNVKDESYFSVYRQKIFFNYFNIILNFINYFIYSNYTFNYTIVYNLIIKQLTDIKKRYINYIKIALPHEK